MAYVPTLKKMYKEQVVPALVKQFGYSSVMQVPVLEKIVINQGLGQAVGDKKIIETAIEELTKSFIDDFAENIRHNKGNTIVRTTIYDPAQGVNLNLYSKRYKVALTPQLMDYLDTNELKYTLS